MSGDFTQPFSEYLHVTTYKTEAQIFVSKNKKSNIWIKIDRPPAFTINCARNFPSKISKKSHITEDLFPNNIKNVFNIHM